MLNHYITSNDLNGLQQAIGQIDRPVLKSTLTKALHFAIKNPDIKPATFKALIKAGANVFKTIEDRSALVLAMEVDDTDATAAIIEAYPRWEDWHHEFPTILGNDPTGVHIKTLLPCLTYCGIPLLSLINVDFFKYENNLKDFCHTDELISFLEINQLTPPVIIASLRLVDIGEQIKELERERIQKFTRNVENAMEDTDVIQANLHFDNKVFPYYKDQFLSYDQDKNEEKIVNLIEKEIRSTILSAILEKAKEVGKKDVIDFITDHRQDLEEGREQAMRDSCKIFTFTWAEISAWKCYNPFAPVKDNAEFPNLLTKPRHNNELYSTNASYDTGKTLLAQTASSIARQRVAVYYLALTDALDYKIVREPSGTAPDKGTIHVAKTPDNALKVTLKSPEDKVKTITLKLYCRGELTPVFLNRAKSRIFQQLFEKGLLQDPDRKNRLVNFITQLSDIRNANKLRDDPSCFPGHLTRAAKMGNFHRIAQLPPTLPEILQAFFKNYILGKFREACGAYHCVAEKQEFMHAITDLTEKSANMIITKPEIYPEKRLAMRQRFIDSLDNPTEILNKIKQDYALSIQKQDELYVTQHLLDIARGDIGLAVENYIAQMTDRKPTAQELIFNPFDIQTQPKEHEVYKIISQKLINQLSAYQKSYNKLSGLTNYLHLKIPTLINTKEAFEKELCAILEAFLNEDHPSDEIVKELSAQLKKLSFFNQQQSFYNPFQTKVDAMIERIANTPTNQAFLITPLQKNLKSLQEKAAYFSALLPLMNNVFKDKASSAFVVKFTELVLVDHVFFNKTLKLDSLAKNIQEGLDDEGIATWDTAKVDPNEIKRVVDDFLANKLQEIPPSSVTSTSSASSASTSSPSAASTSSASSASTSSTSTTAAQNTAFGSSAERPVTQASTSVAWPTVSQQQQSVQNPYTNDVSKILEKIAKTPATRSGSLKVLEGELKSLQEKEEYFNDLLPLVITLLNTCANDGFVCRFTQRLVDYVIKHKAQKLQTYYEDVILQLDNEDIKTLYTTEFDPVELNTVMNAYLFTKHSRKIPQSNTNALSASSRSIAATTTVQKPVITPSVEQPLTQPSTTHVASSTQTQQTTPAVRVPPQPQQTTSPAVPQRPTAGLPSEPSEIKVDWSKYQTLRQQIFYALKQMPKFIRVNRDGIKIKLNPFLIGLAVCLAMGGAPWWLIAAGVATGGLAHDFIKTLREIRISVNKDQLKNQKDTWLTENAPAYKLGKKSCDWLPYMKSFVQPESYRHNSAFHIGLEEAKRKRAARQRG